MQRKETNKLNLSDSDKTNMNQELNKHDSHDRLVVEAVMDDVKIDPNSCTPEVRQWAVDWADSHPEVEIRPAIPYWQRNEDGKFCLYESKEFAEYCQSNPEEFSDFMQGIKDRLSCSSDHILDNAPYVQSIINRQT